MTLCILGTCALVIVATVVGLVIEYKLEPLHRAREARRWADRVRQDAAEQAEKIISNARQPDQDALARDCLAAFIKREGVPTLRQQKAALFMPPAELGQW